MARQSLARRAPHVAALLAWVVFPFLIFSLLLSLSACGITNAAAPPTGGVPLRVSPTPTVGARPRVLQHATQLRVPAGATGFAVAACGAGEALVSGGYSIPAVDGWMPFNIESYPSDLTGAAPTRPAARAD